MCLFLFLSWTEFSKLFNFLSWNWIDFVYFLMAFISFRETCLYLLPFSWLGNAKPSTQLLMQTLNVDTQLRVAKSSFKLRWWKKFSLPSAKLGPAASFSATPPTAVRSLTLCGVSHSRQSSSETNNGPTHAPPYPGVPPSGIPPPFVSQWQTLCDYHIQLARLSRTELLPVNDVRFACSRCLIRTSCSLSVCLCLNL